MNLLYIKWGSMIGNSWIWECLLLEGVPLHAENSSGVGPRAVLEDRSRANESALAPVLFSKELGVQPYSVSSRAEGYHTSK